MGANLTAIIGCIVMSMQQTSKAFGGGIWKKPPCFPLDYGLQHSPLCMGQNGPARGLGLKRRDSKVLHSREKESPCAAVILRQLHIRNPAEERHMAGISHGFQAPALRPLPYHQKANLCKAGGLHRPCYPFIGHQGRNDQKKVLRRPKIRGKGIQVDGRVNHPGLSPPETPDLHGDMAGIRRESIHLPAALPVPTLHHGPEETQSGITKEPTPKIVGKMIPNIAHGGKNVGQVAPLAGAGGSLCDAVTCGKDQIVLRRWKPVDEMRHEGKQRTVVLPRAGQAGKTRLDHVHPLQAGAQAIRFVEKGKEVGTGKKLAKLLQDTLTPPHAVEPIMHNGDAPGFGPGGL